MKAAHRKLLDSHSGRRAWARESFTISHNRLNDICESQNGISLVRVKADASALTQHG